MEIVDFTFRDQPLYFNNETGSWNGSLTINYYDRFSFSFKNDEITFDYFVLESKDERKENGEYYHSLLEEIKKEPEFLENVETLKSILRLFEEIRTMDTFSIDITEFLKGEVNDVYRFELIDFPFTFLVGMNKNNTIVHLTAESYTEHISPQLWDGIEAFGKEKTVMFAKLLLSDPKTRIRKLFL